MSKVFFYGHNGSDNHGCEALVRSSSLILNNCGFNDINLASGNKGIDAKYNLDKIVNIYDEQSPYKKGLKYIIAWLKLKVFKNAESSERLPYLNGINKINQGDVYVAIGGDNYCYSNRRRYVRMHSLAKKRTKNTVLWGCSVEDVNDELIKKDLASYSLIIARESLTYELLKPINPNIVLLPDPAFTLPTETAELPNGITEEILSKSVGINVSPMVIGLESDNGITLKNYEVLIEHILNTTSDYVALIPHVVLDGGNDNDVLNILYDKFKDSKRVYLVPDQNACKIKYVISKLKSLVCARTHASIAGYSSLVPTLVVGYSIKAKGIAKDIFGDYNGYVLPVQSLVKADALMQAYQNLMDNYDAIKDRLNKVIPDMIKRSYQMGEEVKKLIK